MTTERSYQSPYEESNERERANRPVDRARRLDVLATIEDGARTLGHRLIGAHSSLAVPLLRAWDAYVYLHVRSVTLRNSIGREAEIDPFQLHWIDVDRIQYVTEPLPDAKFQYAGRVMGGDWDRVGEPFEQSDVYRAFESHFEHEVDWQETEFFDRVVGQIDDGQEMWGCRSREAFERRCDRLDALYEDIREHGYRTQAELATGAVDEPVKKDRASALARFIHDEMTVSVARDGELLFNDGRDRLAIVKLLGLEEVPVWILRRHEEWQRLRDDLANGRVERHELPEKLRTHPDLSNLGRRLSVGDGDLGW